MELFEVLRSRMVWTMIAVVAVVAGVTALVWPAVAITLVVVALAVGAVASVFYALYELAVAASHRGRAAPEEPPALRIMRVEEAEVAELPADRR